MSDSEISIDIIARWDEKSTGMLYDNFYKALVSYSLQITSSLSVSEDLVQEVFSRLWEKKIVFSNMLVLKTYLYNSVRNLSVSYLRHKNVEVTHSQNVAAAEEYHLDAAGEEEFFTEEVYRQLFAMIDQLPPRQREIFLMCMEGKKNKDIAAALEISVETVKTQKKRAIKYLKKNLGDKAFMLLVLLS